MRVYFKYFCKLFDHKNNIFVNVLEKNFNEFKSWKIEIHSVFTRPRRFYHIYIQIQIYFRLVMRRVFKFQKIYIWYTGELIDPPKGYDLTLSFLPTQGNNVYWPLWATYTDYMKVGSVYDRGFSFPINKLMSLRELESIEGRKWKACAFLSEAIGWRFELAKELECLGLLDIFGKSVGKEVVSKSTVAKNYLFQFCFENKVQGLYVTEKPFEAWLDGNIPIYFGGSDVEYLNTNAMIDCRDLQSSKIPQFIKSQMKDKAASLKKWNQPILQKPYNYEYFQDFLYKCILNRSNL
jgi:hypothetical protein